MICKRCEEDRPHKARGLCKDCYGNARYHGKIDEFPLSLSETDAAIRRAKARARQYYRAPVWDNSRDSLDIKPVL